MEEIIMDMELYMNKPMECSNADIVREFWKTWDIKRTAQTCNLSVRTVRAALKRAGISSVSVVPAEDSPLHNIGLTVHDFL